MIDLGNNYYLKADSFQFILFQKGIAAKGKTKGEETEILIGYYPSIELLIKKIFSKELQIYLNAEEVTSWEKFEETWKTISVIAKEASKRIGSVQNLKRIFEQEEK